jgi:hypothetical protein
MVKRFLFKRVEQWINGLEPEYKNRGFISASLRLFGILGLPTNFSTVVKEKRTKESEVVYSLENQIKQINESRLTHEQRVGELLKLEELLG